MPTPETPRQILTDIALCLAFFTRLPIPRIEVQHRTLGEAIWAAPLVGVAVALVGSVIYALAVLTGLSAGIGAALALAAMMLATGCLHEDGLADVADGFGGGTTREKKLEIMRDSRIGTYGTVALILSILARWSAISDLASPLHVLCGLVAAQAASRALLPAFMHLLPPARPDGLAATAGWVSPETAMIAAAIGLAGLLFIGPAGLIAAVLTLAIVFFAFRHLCLRQIGGQTGDTLGALQQLADITVLIVAAAVLY